MLIEDTDHVCMRQLSLVPTSVCAGFLSCRRLLALVLVGRLIVLAFVRVDICLRWLSLVLTLYICRTKQTFETGQRHSIYRLL